MSDEKRAALVREVKQAFPGISDAEVEERMRAYDNSLMCAAARVREAFEPIRHELMHWAAWLAFKKFRLDYLGWRYLLCIIGRHQWKRYNPHHRSYCQVCGKRGVIDAGYTYPFSKPAVSDPPGPQEGSGE